MDIPDGFKKKKVLIIDDQASIRTLTRAYLTDAGFTSVVDTNSPKKALNGLLKSKVDLIICDINMPEMSGIELLRHLKSDERLKDISFLLFTGEADAGSVKEALELGVDSFLVKPFQPVVLYKKMVDIFAKSAG